MRDRAQQDKVVEVREPLDTISLYYNPDNENRLAFVKTVYPDSNMIQLIKLGYQDYLNSKNQIENVVTTVEQRTATTNGEQDEDYTKLNNELHALINNNS